MKAILLASLTLSLAFAFAPTAEALKAGCNGSTTTTSSGNRTTTDSCAVAVNEGEYVACFHYQSQETVREENRTNWEHCENGIK